MPRLSVRLYGLSPWTLTPPNPSALLQGGPHWSATARRQLSQYPHRPLGVPLAQAVADAQAHSRRGLGFWSLFAAVGGCTLLVATYVGYQTAINHQPVFIPLWPLPRTRPVYPGEVDVAAIQASAETAVLERLTLHPVVRDTFGLPLVVGVSTDFEVWIEERKLGVWGVEFRPTFVSAPSAWLPLTASRATRRFRINDVWAGLLVPVLVGRGTSASEYIHVVPVTDALHRPVTRDTDVVFSGTVAVASSRATLLEQRHVLATSGRAEFRGVVDFEHHQTVKLGSCALVEDGHVTQLW